MASILLRPAGGQRSSRQTGSGRTRLLHLGAHPSMRTKRRLLEIGSVDVRATTSFKLHRARAASINVGDPASLRCSCRSRAAEADATDGRSGGDQAQIKPHHRSRTL